MARQIKFGVASRNYFNMPYWVAQHAGFFESAGLAVEGEVIEHIPETDIAVCSGRLPVVYGAAEQAVISIEDGKPIRIVGGNIRRLPFSFIAHPDIRGIADLRGKVIGVSSLDSGTSSLLRQFLDRRGLAYQKDYTMEAVGPIVSRWQKLQSGEIQAGLQGIPMNYVALDAGFADLGAYSDGIDELEFNSLIFNMDWARANPDLATDFMTALVRAHRWLFANREDAAAIAMKEAGFERAYANRAWDDFTSRGIFPHDGDISLPGLQKLTEISADVRVRPDRSRGVERYIDRSFWQAAAGA